MVDPLRDFSNNYYNKYPKLGKMVQKVIKAAQMKENQCVAVVKGFFPLAIFSPTLFFSNKLSNY